MKRLALPFLLGSACLLAAEAIVFRGAVIHTVSGPDIPNGVVLVRDGRIAEAGTRIASPRGARVIDLKGLHLYPGLIDSATEIGLTEVAAVRETNDADEVGDFNPQLRAIVAVNPASEHIAVTRANGITSIVTAPSGGVISGQAAFVHLDGWTWEEMAIRPAAALELHYPVIETRSHRGFGPPARRPFKEAKQEYDRRVRQLREFIEQARRYEKAKAAGGPSFETDLKLEAMLPVLAGKVPVVVHAERLRAIRDAIWFATQEKVRIIIAGGAEAAKAAAELKANGVPVVLGPSLSLPLEEDDPYDARYAAASELYKAGVKFAFGSFSTAFARNLPYQAATAVAFGLPPKEGLKAVTLNAAEIWGAGSELGSIDKGKWADLIVTDGDPLETRTRVLREFIKGREVSLENKHKRLAEKYLARE